MNRTYRLIWSKTLGMLVPVAETAGARGKSASPRRRARRRASALAVVAGATATLGLTPRAGLALPTDGQVVSGQATISQAGKTLTVTQASDRAILNWSRFGIASGETVTFRQPGAGSIALNRVLGSDPSVLFGRLNANGQVFLVNPNGVYFAPGAQVNVGGIVASTLGIGNADFLAGKYRFSGDSDAAVTNKGTINAAQGGTVAFIGTTVRNDGTISTPGGATALGAGSKVTMTLAGNSLLGFTVDGAAVKALARNGGLIQADGGQVILTAQAKDALLDTVVNNTGVIRAQTVQEQDGSIVLLGGAEGTTRVSGTLDASAPNGGDGGFIETSGAHLKVADGTVITTKAAAGANGQWLIDPYDFTIAASGGDITGATLSAALASGDVTIQTTDLGTACLGTVCGGGTAAGNGDIFVNDTVTWSAKTLTLDAWRNIEINSEMFGSGTAKLVFKYGQGAVAAGNTATYTTRAPVNLASTGTFSTKLGSDGTTNTYTIITDLGAAGSTTGTDLQGINGALAGRYVLGADIDASATSGWNAGEGFLPIGNETTKFTGTFDGLGHTISEMKIYRRFIDNIGLFGFASGATIRNVGVVGGSVRGAYLVGALSGRAINNTTISNVYSSAAVSASGSVGGLVGSLSNSRINNAYVTATVVATRSEPSTAGLVGFMSASAISNVYFTGSVSGAANTAGLIGYHLSSTTRNAYAAGTVNGTGINPGGLIGYIYGSGVTASYWDKEVSGQTRGTGVPASNGLTTAQMQQQASFVGWDFADTWVMYEGHTYPMLRAFMKPLTVTAGARTKTYDGTSAMTLNTPTYSVAGVEASGHLFGLSDAYGSNAVNVGTYASSDLWSDQQGYIIDQTGVGALTINRAALTLSGITAANKVYDATTAATMNTAGAIYTGLMSGDDVTVSATGTFANKNVGNGKIVTIASTYGGADAGNYTITDQTSTTADITPATLTVDGLAASNKVYDRTTAASLVGTASITALGADTVTLNGTGVGSFADKTVGTGKAVTVTGYSLGGTDAANYTIVQPTGLTADITPAALTIGGITAANRVYNGTTAATVNTAGATYAGLIAGDSVVVSATGSFADKNAGTGKTVTLASTYSGADLGNYTITDQATTTADITPAALTVGGLIAGSKVYDGTTAAMVNTAGATYTGLIAGDSVVVNATGSFADKNVGTGKAVTIASTYGGADAGNYTITDQTAATANITPAALTVSGITAANKVYDGTTAAAVNMAGATYAGLIVGDSVVVNATGSFADKNAGTGKTVTLASTYSGADLGNYTITDQATTTADITPAALTVSGITAANKVYDRTTAATVNTAGATYAGLIAGDSVVVSAAGSFADKNAGNGKAVTLASTYGGADVGNYTITGQATTTADITPRAVNLAAPSVTKTYDGTTAYTTKTGDLRPLTASLLNGDSVTGATITYADAAAGSNKVVMLDSVTIDDGNGGANYAVTLAGNATSTILLSPAATNFDSATGPAAALTQSGYLVPVSGASIQLDPMQWYQLVNGAAKPTAVQVEASDGGVDTPAGIPAASCTGQTTIAPFDAPGPASALCGG